MSNAHPIPASFDTDGTNVVDAWAGQRVHARTIDQMDRLAERLYEVSDGVWCMVGNGLSNQTFVEGPEGLIAIDTGESVEEMQAALDAVRAHTAAPVVAVIYTHFHYCNGTTALPDAANLPIWGHEKIEANLSRIAAEVGPIAGRGLIHQMGMMLPADGPDGLVGAGLGRFYKNPAHGRGTPGHLAVTDTISGPTSTTMAGLRVEMTVAPSDADDNINIFFPDLELCVNNLVWPALFNVFPIRGEEYRDPRVLLHGIDEIADFDPEHLVCAHGPPISGRDEIRPGVCDARDAIQSLWDQTVRGMNRGLTIGELIAEVQLPGRFERSYLTQQHYGLVEHHVRQIYIGLRGWFDGTEADLFPLPAPERAQRMIDGFGGRAEVMRQAGAALDADDVRWALELATWLVRSEVGTDGRADAGSPDERALLAAVLRTIGQRSTAANIRNWCLTGALELEGQIDLSRHRGFRTSRGQVLSREPATFVHGLKTTLVPERSEHLDTHVGFQIDDSLCGLHVRGGVAVPTDGSTADHTIGVTLETWAELVSARLTTAEAIAARTMTIAGDAAAVHEVLRAFDHPTLGS